MVNVLNFLIKSSKQNAISYWFGGQEANFGPDRCSLTINQEFQNLKFKVFKIHFHDPFDLRRFKPSEHIRSGDRNPIIRISIDTNAFK